MFLLVPVASVWLPFPTVPGQRSCGGGSSHEHHPGGIPPPRSRFQGGLAGLVLRHWASGWPYVAALPATCARAQRQRWKKTTKIVTMYACEYCRSDAASPVLEMSLVIHWATMPYLGGNDVSGVLFERENFGWSDPGGGLRVAGRRRCWTGRSTTAKQMSTRPRTRRQDQKRWSEELKSTSRKFYAVLDAHAWVGNWEKKGGEQSRRERAKGQKDRFLCRRHGYNVV